MTPAIVLAAGASSRMGRPKALLPAGDRTFIRTILDCLREGGIADAVVIVRPGQDALTAAVEASGFGRAVENPRADEGQLSSLIIGLDAIDRPGVDAVLVTLVDVPLIGAASVRLLLDRAAVSDAPVLRAVHQGRHGHPVIFKRVLFDPLRRADPATGAKAVVRSVPVEDVETGDPGSPKTSIPRMTTARLFNGRRPPVNPARSQPVIRGGRLTAMREIPPHCPQPGSHAALHPDRDRIAGARDWRHHRDLLDDGPRVVAHAAGEGAGSPRVPLSSRAAAGQLVDQRVGRTGVQLSALPRDAGAANGVHRTCRLVLGCRGCRL